MTRAGESESGSWPHDVTETELPRKKEIQNRYRFFQPIVVALNDAAWD